MKQYRTGTGLSALALMIGAPAFGQEAATPPLPSAAEAAAVAQDTPSDAGIVDIVVTAQRRSESIQKAALTIAVIEPEALGKAGVTAPGQLATIVPTVQIGFSGPSTSIYVRGVGGFASTAATSPAVPYYIDGVYVARTQSVASELYDVDRLEVVKGPQGTLYGRNASGGAINILTRRPALGEVQARGDFEIGNYGNQSADVALNVPIGDTVAIRASGTIVDKGGFTSLGFGDDVHQSGRVKLLWEPSSEVSLLLNGSYGHIGGRTSAQVAANRDIAGWYPWLDISDPRTQAYANANSPVPVPGFVRPSDRSDARQDLRFFNLSAQLDWTFGATTLTVIPAYRDSKMQYAGLLGFVFNNGYAVGALPARPETSKATSVEARLSGNGDVLKWVLGLYYANEDQFEQYAINGGFLQSNGIIASLGTRTYAGFGQATYAISDAVRLIGGIRYTSDRRTLSDGQSYVVSPAAFLGPPPAQAVTCALPAVTQPQCLVDGFAGRKTFSNVSWKGGVEADVLRDSLFYATASRGFKAGGFNFQSGLSTPGQASIFNPETLTSYEAGLKSRFLDNRLQVNVSAFYWDYKNHQEPVLTYTNVPGVTNLIYLNAGTSEIYGGDLDVVARPWAGGTINASVEYAHSVYKSFGFSIPTFSYSPASSGCRVAAQDAVNTRLDCSGFQTARTPEWAGGVGVTQDVPLASGKLVANANLTFASARWTGVDFIPTERAKGYGKLDASLTYQAPQSRWSITGFVRNITNATVYGDGAKAPFTPLVYTSIQPPRTYGARLGFDF